MVPLRSRCHHHYLEYEESTNDLVEVGAIFSKWTDCGHMDFPLDVQETIESNVKEKRNYPISPAQLYLNLLDFS